MAPRGVWAGRAAALPLQRQRDGERLAAVACGWRLATGNEKQHSWVWLHAHVPVLCWFDSPRATDAEAGLLFEN